MRIDAGPLARWVSPEEWSKNKKKTKAKKTKGGRENLYRISPCKANLSASLRGGTPLGRRNELDGERATTTLCTVGRTLPRSCPFGTLFKFQTRSHGEGAPTRMSKPSQQHQRCNLPEKTWLHERDLLRSRFSFAIQKKISIYKGFLKVYMYVCIYAFFF